MCEKASVLRAAVSLLELEMVKKNFACDSFLVFERWFSYNRRAQLQIFWPNTGRANIGAQLPEWDAAANKETSSVVRDKTVKSGAEENWT